MSFHSQHMRLPSDQ